MVIGIDVNTLWSAKWTGVERFVFSLVKGMMRRPLPKGVRVRLYAMRVISELGALPEGFEWKIVSSPVSWSWTHVGLSRELFLHPPDVFFSPGHEIPLFARTGKIVSVVHDVAFLKQGDLYGKRAGLRQRFAMMLVRLRTNRILVPSEVTKRDLQEFGRIREERIEVVSPGIPERVEPSGEKIDGAYFLSVGRLEKKKNTAFFIRAFEKIGGGNEMKLVLAGMYGEHGREEIETLIAKSPVRERIIVLGFVDDARLAQLYKDAEIFVFASKEEGFGFPLLEAMRAGVPVLCSDIPIFHEVAGDSALFASPENEDAFANAMKTLCEDRELRERLIALGNTQYLKFSWDTASERVMNLLML